MQFLVTVPANNERGPRYMEKALAAIHQARLRRPVTFSFGTHQGQIGLFIHCHPRDRETVLEPIIASYPQSSIVPVDELSVTAAFESWSTDIELKPELFPILRHAQFEDTLNHNFADPVSGLLRAILPDQSLDCRIEIHVRRATRHRAHTHGPPCVCSIESYFGIIMESPRSSHIASRALAVGAWHGCSAWRHGARRIPAARPWKLPPADNTIAKKTCKPPPRNWAGICSRLAFD